VCEGENKSEWEREEEKKIFLFLSIPFSLTFISSFTHRHTRVCACTHTHTHTHTHTLSLSLSLSLSRARARICTNTFTNIYKFLQSNKNLELKENIEPSASARPVNVSYFRTHTYFNLYLSLFLPYTQTHLLIYINFYSWIKISRNREKKCRTIHICTTNKRKFQLKYRYYNI